MSNRSLRFRRPADDRNFCSGALPNSAAFPLRYRPPLQVFRRVRRLLSSVAEIKNGAEESADSSALCVGSDATAVPDIGDIMENGVILGELAVAAINSKVLVRVIGAGASPNDARNMEIRAQNDRKGANLARDIEILTKRSKKDLTWGMPIQHTRDPPELSSL